MYNFNFHAASSLDDAVAKLGAAEDGTLMAGGQTLIPVLKQRLANPSDVIDLSGIAELNGISASGDGVTIGAMTTHAAVATSSDVPAALRAVAEGIGDPQVRNRGTLAVPSPTMIRRRIIRRPFWAWVPPSPPISVTLRPMIFSPACLKPR